MQRSETGKKTVKRGTSRQTTRKGSQEMNTLLLVLGGFLWVMLFVVAVHHS